MNPLSQASTNLLRDTQAILIDEKRKADNTITTKAFTDVQNHINELYWNNETGVVTRRNEDAKGVTPEFLGKLQNFTDDYGERFTNNTQRGIFDQQVAQLSSRFNQSLSKHEFQEMRNFADITNKDLIFSSKNTAGLFSHDLTIVDKARENMVAGVKTHLADRDTPDKVADEIIKNEVSDFNSIVMKSIINGGDIEKAKEYFKKHNKEFNFEDKTEITKFLKQATLDSEGLRLGIKIVDDNPGDLKKQLAERDRLTKDKPDLFKIVTAHLNARNKENVAISVEQHKKDFQTAVDQANARGDIFLIDVSIRDKMSIEEMGIISKIIQRIPEVTDWGVYNQAFTNLDSNPEKELKMHPLMRRPFMANAEYKEYVKARRKAEGGDRSTELDDWRSKTLIHRKTLSDYELPELFDDNDWINDVAFEEKQRQKQFKPPRDLTNNEYQDMLDEMLTDVKILGLKGIGIFDKGFFGFGAQNVGGRIFASDTKLEKKIFELAPGEEFKAENITQISRSEVREIRGLLIEEGSDPNDEDEILRIYNVRKFGKVK